MTFPRLHTSVLLDESVENLLGMRKTDHRTIVDATLGLGGHSAELLARMGPSDRLVGIDRDRENLGRASERLAQAGSKARLDLVHASFADLPGILADLGIASIDGILYDLGVSSVHYDEAERGFSTRFDGPLDMRFDRSGDSPTVAEYLRAADEAELVRIFRDYADEPKAFFVARALVEARKSAPVRTTFELKAAVEAASFDPKSAIRVFQALRIAVNGELEHVERSLRQAVEALAPGGRICVITFHSIEDRLVKTCLKAYEAPETDPVTGRILKEAVLKKVHKKPIEPSEAEIRDNPRSRSAKLRVLEKR